MDLQFEASATELSNFAHPLLLGSKNKDSSKAAMSHDPFCVIIRHVTNVTINQKLLALHRSHAFPPALQGNARFTSYAPLDLILEAFPRLREFLRHVIHAT